MGVLPTRMMPMGVWRKSVPALPYDAEVEYLEITTTSSTANRNEHIVTDVEQTSDIGFEVGFLVPDGKNQYIIGSSDGWGSSQFLFYINNDNNLNVSYPSGAPAIISGLTRNVQHVATFSNKTFVLDGTTTKTGTKDPVANARKIKIFGNRYVVAGQRIYYVKLYHGATLVFDGTPVRKGTKGYLYDRVSKRIYGNAGTGSFTLGPDK